LWWLLLWLLFGCALLLRGLLLSPLLDPRLLWLLSGLFLPRLGLVLMSACLRLFPTLRALLLRGRRCSLLLPTLLLFRPAFSFVFLVVLRECRDHRPEKQKQGGGA